MRHVVNGIVYYGMYIMGAKMSSFIMVPLLTVFFVIIGLLMFIFCLMIEIMIKTYYGVHIDTPYSVKEVIENIGGSNRKGAVFSNHFGSLVQRQVAE